MTVPDATTALAYDKSGPKDDPAIWEETARRYDRCHPNDTFADLVRRSSFSKEDRRLVEDWLASTSAPRVT